MDIPGFDMQQHDAFIAIGTPWSSRLAAFNRIAAVIAPSDPTVTVQRRIRDAHELGKCKHFGRPPSATAHEGEVFVSANARLSPECQDFIGVARRIVDVAVRRQ